MKDVESVYAPYREANDANAANAASLSNASTPRAATSPDTATVPVPAAAVSERRGGGGGRGGPQQQAEGQGTVLVPFLGFGEKRPKEVPFLPFGGSGRDRPTGAAGETAVPVRGTIKKVGDDALNPIHATGKESAASSLR